MTTKRSSQDTPAAKRHREENGIEGLTMQLLVTFPDSELPDVVFLTTTNSLVKDAVEAAAEEWGMVAEFIELSYSGVVLSSSSILLSHGVEADSQLTASLLQLVGKDLLEDEDTRGKIDMLLVKRNGDHILRLDTPTFTDDGGCLFLPRLPLEVENLSIHLCNPNPANTTVFLFSASDATSVDLLGLQHVTSTRFHFLKFGLMETLDLSPLCNLTSIGEGFLYRSSLKSLDLTPLSNLTTIGDCFLASCESLVTVSFCLGNVTSVGDGFLENCCSLTTCDLSSLINVTCIGEDFLSGCEGLSELNLSPMACLTDVGTGSFDLCDSFSMFVVDKQRSECWRGPQQATDYLYQRAREANLLEEEVEANESE